MFSCTDHSGYSSRFLYSECLDHLEDIHHSLCLTPLNGGGYGTEHPRPAHCVTAHNNTHMHSNTRKREREADLQ